MHVLSVKASNMTIICCEFSAVKKDQCNFCSELVQSGTIFIKGGNLHFE